MAKVVVTGAAGFLGRLVIRRLLADGFVRVRGCCEEIDQLITVDQVADIPSAGDPRVLVIKGNIYDILHERPSLFLNATVVFHLAGAVSAECEIDFELGLQSNVINGIALANLLRRSESNPILVFASSLAIYGSEKDQTLPLVITDEVRPTPQNSYGAQKLMLEIFFADIARRGELSVRTLRLMTVSIRPDRPNGAASGFLSGMIREPLNGLHCNVPVPLDLQVCLNSPKQAIDGLLSSCDIPDEQWGTALGMNLPGLALSIGEMVEALRSVGGEEAVSLLTYRKEPDIISIVGAWPSQFESKRAEALGFTNQLTFVDFIQSFLTSDSEH